MAANYDPTTPLGRCRLVELPRHTHLNGSLTEVDNGRPTLPFEVRRIFYIYDVPGDAVRGAHAHHREEQLLVAASGSFDVVVSDATGARRTFTLRRPYQGLYLPPGVWRGMEQFSSGSICLVLSSMPYTEDDYIRSHEEYVEIHAQR